MEDDTFDTADTKDTEDTKEPVRANKKAICVRHVSNWTSQKAHHKFEKSTFDPERTRAEMPMIAPKMKVMLDKIRELDERDQKLEGKLYKHMIFSDIVGVGGAKSLAAAMLAGGYSLAFGKDLQLMSTGSSQSFALLCSTRVYGNAYPVGLRKSILKRYNERPGNIHGEKLRFIVLDYAYKEGIDLFDVKYVHVLEFPVSESDEKQIIGRATRMCGQKGLNFLPNEGWPLYVFRYETYVPRVLREKYKSTNLHEMFLTFANFDQRKQNCTEDLDKMLQFGAIDMNLTANIHRQKVHALPPVQQKAGGAPAASGRAPPRLLPLEAMHRFIAAAYPEPKFWWPKVVLENQCLDKSGPTQGPAKGYNLVSLTPTQDFLRNYFQPASAYKGLLLYHSVGTGKTCSAIAVASTFFEQAGYTILWVTRHTLKKDIYKNLFKDICSEALKQKIARGWRPPAASATSMDGLSKSWIPPISYKQFSNLVSKKNDLYKQMVKRNGAKDPLKKTLVIIDEAHKLFNNDLLPQEQPDVNMLQETLLNSYRSSGKDSARILLMSATPFTPTEPQIFIQLANLMREDALPVEFDAFAKAYLRPDGHFTREGATKFMDQISGYISYLNQSNDARKFAQPIYQNIMVEMTPSQETMLARAIDKTERRLQRIEQDIAVCQDAKSLARQRLEDERARLVADCNKWREMAGLEPAERLRRERRCLGHVKTRMVEFETNLLYNAQSRIEQENTEATQLKNKIERLEASKRSAKKDDSSQEAVMDERCIA